jgi:hypothetical protein
MDEQERKRLGTITRLNAMISRVDHQFRDNEEFVLNTKRMFRDELGQIEAVAEGADEAVAELLFEDYLRNDEVFPEMFMTAWIIATFSYFEHWLDRIIEDVPGMLNKRLSLWPKVKGKFNLAEKYLQNDLSLSIDQDHVASMHFYKKLRNQLAHEGRLISEKKMLVQDVRRMDDIECRDVGRKKLKIVIQKSFALTMNRNLRKMLISALKESKKQLAVKAK